MGGVSKCKNDGNFYRLYASDEKNSFVLFFVSPITASITTSTSIFFRFIPSCVEEITSVCEFVRGYNESGCDEFSKCINNV